MLNRSLVSHSYQKDTQDNGGSGGGPSRVQLNVLGDPLETCSSDPLTGWFRDGCCKTDAQDRGSHTICCVVTETFLSFSKSHGNDLSTPRPEFDFPGLVDGDSWCLCASRWLDAYKAKKAPKVKLKCTNKLSLLIVDLDALKEHAIDL